MLCRGEGRASTIYYLIFPALIDDNEIYHIVALSIWMCPRPFTAIFMFEVRVCHAQLIGAAEL